MTSYEGIKQYYIFWGNHPKAVHSINLMEAYSGDLQTIDSLWTDATAGGYKTPLDDPDLLTELKRIIAHEHIAPLATETADPASIAAIINALQVGIIVGGKIKAFNKNNFLRALEEARNGSTEISIGIKTMGMYFDESQPLSYLDWSRFSMDKNAFPAQAGTTAPAPAAAQPATITATFDPTAVANLMNNLNIASGRGAAGSNTTIARSVNLGLFNYNALPTDVKERYEKKTNGGIVTGIEVLTNYSTDPIPTGSDGHRYHVDGADRLILADGTLFVMGQTPNEKALIKADIYCEDESYAGLRTWYENILGPTCRLYGVYIHPFWCFRKDKGGSRGFVCGDDKDDDIPSRLKLPLEEMSPILYRVLLRRGMFGKDSRNPAIVQSCPGDGYAALKAIIRKAHPVFHEEPATMVKKYPVQSDNQTLREYHKVFKDYLQLRAFCMNHASSLDEEHEKSIFIDNAKHRLHLRRCTREERRQPALAERYQGEQLVDTLEEFLMAADSPIWYENTKKKSFGDKKPSRDWTAPSRPFQLGLKKPSKTAHVNHIGFASSDPAIQDFFNTEDNEDDDDDNGNNGTSAGLHPVVKAVYSITVPEDPKSLDIFHAYALGVNKIVADSKKAQDQTCVVCDGKHTFENCKVLQNVDFLRGHYVRMCQLLKRDANAKAASTDKGKPRTLRPVNFVDGARPGVATESSESESDRDDDETVSDFPNGRM